MASYSSVVKDAGTFKTTVPHRSGFTAPHGVLGTVDKGPIAASVGNLASTQQPATREWRRSTEASVANQAQSTLPSSVSDSSGDKKQGQAPNAAFRGLTKQDLERSKPEGADWRQRAPENVQTKQWRGSAPVANTAPQSNAENGGSGNASNDALAPSVAALFHAGNVAAEASVASASQPAPTAEGLQAATQHGAPLSAPPGLGAGLAGRALQSAPPGLSYSQPAPAPAPEGVYSESATQQATQQQQLAASQPVPRYVPPQAAQAAQAQTALNQSQPGGYQVQGLNNLQAIPLPPGLPTYPVSAFLPSFATHASPVQQGPSSVPAVQGGMPLSVQRPSEATTLPQAGQSSYLPFQGQAVQGMGAMGPSMGSMGSMGGPMVGQQGGRGYEGLPSFPLSQMSQMQAGPAAFPAFSGYNLPEGSTPYAPMYYGQPADGGAAFGNYAGQAYGAPLAVTAQDRQGAGQALPLSGPEGGDGGNGYTTVRVALPLSQLSALCSGAPVQPLGLGMGPQGGVNASSGTGQAGAGMGSMSSLPTWQPSAVQQGGPPMNTFNINMTFPGLNANSFLPFAQAMQQSTPQASSTSVQPQASQPAALSDAPPPPGSSGQVQSRAVEPEPEPAAPPVAPEEEVASSLPPAKVLSAYKVSASRAHASQLSRHGQVWMQGETRRVHVLLAPGPVVRPRQTVRVYLHGPFTAEKSSGSEWLCLYRAGRTGSQRFTAAKEIKASSGAPDGQGAAGPGENKEGGIMQVRSETIIAPRLPGVYELVLFSSDMDNVPPVGRSMPLIVTAQGKDLSEVLYFQHAGEKAVPVQAERGGRHYGRGFRCKQGGESSSHAAAGVGASAGSAGYVSVIDALTTAGLLPSTEAEQVRAEVAAGPVVVRNKDKEGKKGPGAPAPSSSSSHAWTHPALDAPATGLTPLPTGLARAFAGFAAYVHAKEQEQAGQAPASNVLKHTPPAPVVLELGRLASSISHVQQSLAQVTSVLKRPVVKSTAEGAGYRRRKIHGAGAHPQAEGRTESRSGFSSLQHRTAQDDALLTHVLSSSQVDEEEAEALIADLPQGVSVVEQIPEPDTCEAVWRIVRDVYISALMTSVSYAQHARATLRAEATGQAGTPQGKLCAQIVEQVQGAAQQLQCCGSACGEVASSLLSMQPWLMVSPTLADRAHELTAHGAQASKVEQGSIAAIPAASSVLLNLHSRFVHVQAVHAHAAGCFSAVRSNAELRSCLSPARWGALQAWCNTWEPLSEMFVLGALPAPSASAFVGLNTSGGAPGLFAPTEGISTLAVKACTTIALQLLGRHCVARELAADSWLSSAAEGKDILPPSVGVALTGQEEGKQAGQQEGKGNKGNVDAEMAAAGGRVQDVAFVNKSYAQLAAQKRLDCREAASQVLLTPDAHAVAALLSHNYLPGNVSTISQHLKDSAVAAADSSDSSAQSASALESIRERLESSLQPLVGLLLAAARAVGAGAAQDSKAQENKASNDHRKAPEPVVLPTLYDADGAVITHPLSPAQIDAVVSRYRVVVRLHGLHALVAVGLLPPTVLQSAHSQEPVGLEVSLQPSSEAGSSSSPLSPASEAALLRVAWAPSTVNTHVCKALQQAPPEAEGEDSWQSFSQPSVLVTGPSSVVSALDSLTGCHVHVSPCAALALERTALLGTYISADARVADLFVLAHRWASSRGLLGAHLQGLTSHALLCAVIAHAQRPWAPQDGSAPAHPLLPCLQSLPSHWPFMDAADAEQARQRIESAAKGKGSKGTTAPAREGQGEERKWTLSADGTPYDTTFWSPSTCLAGQVVGAAALSAFADRCTATVAHLFASFLSWCAGLEATDGALASLDARLHAISIRPEAMRNRSHPRAGSHAHVSRATKQLMHGWRVGGAPLAAGGSPSAAGPSSGAPCVSIEDPMEPDCDVAATVSSDVWCAVRLEAVRALLLLTKAAREVEQGTLSHGSLLLASVFSPAARCHAEPALRAQAGEELRKASRASAARARKAMLDAEAAWMAEQAESAAAEEERAREANNAARAAAAAYGARMGGWDGRDRGQQGGPYMGGGYGGPGDYRTQGSQMGGQQGPYFPGPQQGGMSSGWGGGAPDRSAQWMAPGGGPHGGGGGGMQKGPPAMGMNGPPGQGRGGEGQPSYAPQQYAGQMQSSHAPQSARGEYPGWNAASQSFLRPVPGYGQGFPQWGQPQAGEASRQGEVGAGQQAQWARGGGGGQFY